MMPQSEFNEFILSNMPSFIAINYQHLLETQEPQKRAELILHIYNLGLRVLTINLVSQYIFRDRDHVNDPYLDKLLEQRFPHLTLDAWEEMLFTTLRSYEGNQDLLFMPELYDFYWDTSTYPHRRRDGVKSPFDRLTQATLEIQTKLSVPQDKSGWQALAEELLEHLYKILQDLSFIGKYDLIYVLEQDEHSYTFELHKGIRIVINRRPLPSLPLIPDYFYLRSSTEDFLRLDPWLVFWKRTGEGNEFLPTDTGVFDRLVYESLRYLLTTPGQTRLDDMHVSEFVHLIVKAIEEVKRERIESEKLTWVQLCDICEEITKRRMATVRGKYHKRLYLQRNKARQHFEQFLADPKKPGFVLVGNSGVGKSNFLLALAEELQSSSNICVLMYNGANVPVVSLSLTEIISQDFSDWVFLSRQPVQHIWREIARIDGIDERRVILCVDAINENPKATELLRQLDELIQAPWPWLKIVLSSRPETWQSIKHGVTLAEALYYQDPDTEALGMELEPFSYSEQIDPFSRQELPEVYSKYRLEFKLQTPYEALSHEVRETLRDPLNLWLLASTYREKEIPENVKVSMLIEQYVNALLQREDLRFLENRLMPLMVKEGHFSNVITEAELDSAGDALYEMVYSKQMLSDGQRMNESFLYLTDAGILVPQKQGFEQQIAFKYERFYEYFAGKRLASISETQTDRYAFFIHLIEEANHTHFLWGAVRNALIEEARKHGSQTLQKLCYTDQQRTKEMMVSVLTGVGLDNQKLVEDILRSLIPSEKKATELQKGRQLLGRSELISDVYSRNAGKIAIEVASNLNILWLLQRAALQDDPTIRSTAVRYSFRLWQHDQARGFEILDDLAEHAVHGFLPNIAAFESALGLSVLIFFDHYQDRPVLLKLQSIWRNIIAGLLRIREGSGRLEGAVRTFIRERVFSFVIRFVLRLLREFPGYNFIDYQGLVAFFHLGTDEKALYRRLIQYFDVEGTYSKEQMEHDYLEVIKFNNILLSSVEQMGLTAHACYAPLDFLPFLKKLFEAAKSDVTTYPYMADVIHVLASILDFDPMLNEVFDFFVYTAEVCQRYYTKYPQALRGSSQAPEANFLAIYVFNNYRRTGTVKTEWLIERIQAALSQNNLPFFDQLLTIELSIAGIEAKKPLAALDALELFFKSGNSEIDQKIQSFLSRLRIYYPDEVDDFLEVQEVSDDYKLQIRMNQPAETVGELIGLKSWFFIRHGIMDSPDLRSRIMTFFEQAADSKNVQDWVEHLIRELINLIYGGEALRQSA